MKFNEEFVVVIGNEEFRNNGIEKMSVSFEGLEMTVPTPHGSRYIKCALTEADICPIERADMRKDMAETVCRNAVGEEVLREKAPECQGYYACGDRGFYGPPIGNPDDDIEVVSPLRNMRKAFKEAIEEMGETLEAIKFDISEDGKQFAKSVKLGNATRDAIKEVVREVMTENASERILAKKVKLEIDPGAFAKIMKKYKQDQARRSGGD